MAVTFRPPYRNYVSVQNFHIKAIISPAGKRKRSIMYYFLFIARHLSSRASSRTKKQRKVLAAYYVQESSRPSRGFSEG